MAVSVIARLAARRIFQLCFFVLLLTSPIASPARGPVLAAASAASQDKSTPDRAGRDKPMQRLLPASMYAQDLVRYSAPMEVLHSKPYVMVMVNGRGPFRFAIDTGTGGDAIVTSELVEELGLPASGYVHLSDPSGRGEQRVPRVTMQSLQVAGVTFNGVMAAQHSLNLEDGSCQGLLGFTLFRDYLLTLDYPGRQMLLESGDLEADGDPSVIPFRMPDGIPIIPLRIGDHAIDAQIDSGGQGLSLPEDFAVQLKFTAVPTVISNDQSLSTRFQTLSGQTIADVSMGLYTFSRPFIEINPVFPLANLGSTVLQKFSITFDQRNTLVRFTSNQTVFHLAPTPTTIRLQNAMDKQPPDPRLVPAG